MKQSDPRTQLSLSARIRACLELMRPANIVTAFADILAGFSAAGGVLLIHGAIPSFSPGEVGWLLLSTFGLYGGGVSFNDIFDANLDARERPERAIPSGRVTLGEAIVLGLLLLLLGIIAAFRVGPASGAIAILIALCALFYDYRAKNSPWLGPLFMGLCRGGNLLLGCSIFPAVLPEIWFLVFIPLLYIGSITLISRGEVHGGSKTAGFLGLLLILIVLCILVSLGVLEHYALFSALPFILLLGGLTIPPFTVAAFNPDPAPIKKAVKRGVLSLIVLNSALAAGFGGIIFGLLVLVLLPVSLVLSNLFAVT